MQYYFGCESDARATQMRKSTPRLLTGSVQLTTVQGEVPTGYLSSEASEAQKDKSWDTSRSHGKLPKPSMLANLTPGAARSQRMRRTKQTPSSALLVIMPHSA